MPTVARVMHRAIPGFHGTTHSCTSDLPSHAVGLLLATFSAEDKQKTHSFADERLLK